MCFADVGCAIRFESRGGCVVSATRESVICCAVMFSLHIDFVWPFASLIVLPYDGQHGYWS